MQEKSSFLILNNSLHYTKKRKLKQTNMNKKNLKKGEIITIKKSLKFLLF
jgi:hypothetical protein